MLGMWQESIQSNQASLRASKTYVHAMDFMTYAYLQGAQDGEAQRLVDESGALKGTQAPPVTNSPTGGVLAVHTAFAAIPARYALERGQWSEARALEVRPAYPAADAITHFARAMGAARTGGLAAARQDIAQLESLRRVYWKHRTSIGRSRSRSSVSRRKHGRHMRQARKMTRSS